MAQEKQSVIIVNPVTGIAYIFVNGKVIKVPNSKVKSFIEKIEKAVSEIKPSEK